MRTESSFCSGRSAADGKNTCRVNGRPLTVTQLRQIGSELLNIHGQHDGQQLLDEEQHGAYLDRFGATEPVLRAYRRGISTQWPPLSGQIRALRMDEAEKARRMDSLQLSDRRAGAGGAGSRRGGGAGRPGGSCCETGRSTSPRCPAADYCLNGGRGTLPAPSPPLRDAQEAIRHHPERSARIWGSCTGGWTALQSEAFDLAETIRDKRESL